MVTEGNSHSAALLTQPAGEPHTKLNRKTTKIEFLSQENQQLREEILELHTIAKLNKEALKLAMQPQQQQQDETSASRKDGKSVEGSARGENPKALGLVLQALYQENEALMKINQRLIDERNFAQSKALISEQISEASQKHEKELIVDLEEKVRGLSLKVRDQEQEIYQLEKTKPVYDEISGIVIKYRDIINLNEQTQKMHEENEKLSTIVLKQQRELSNYKSDRFDLVKINLSMSNEILRLKAILATPHGRSAYSLPHPGKKTKKNLDATTANEIIVLHQKLMKNMNSEDEEDDDENVEADEEGLMGEENESLGMSEQTHGTSVSTKQSVPAGVVIPKLNLHKALQIQEMNAKKSTLQQMQKQQGTDIGAISASLKKAEQELLVAKRNLQREMLMNKTLKIENDSLKRDNVELAARNEILANSHVMYERRWMGIFKAFSFYRDHYKGVMGANGSIVMNNNSANNNNNNNNGAQNMTQTLMTNSGQQQQYQTSQMHLREKSALDFLNSSQFGGGSAFNPNSNFATSILTIGPLQSIPTQGGGGGGQQQSQNQQQQWQYCESEAEQESMRQKAIGQKSILDMNAHELNLDEEVFKMDPIACKEFYSNYLMALAKDVYGMLTKSRVKQGDQKQEMSVIGQQSGGEQYRLRRSLSNPLEYVRSDRFKGDDEAENSGGRIVNKQSHIGGMKSIFARTMMGDYAKTPKKQKMKKRQWQLQSQEQQEQGGRSDEQDIMIQFSEDMKIHASTPPSMQIQALNTSFNPTLDNQM